MGKLYYACNVLELINTYNLCRFVETGTGVGESLAKALRYPFRSLWSSEIEPTVLDRARDRCVDDRITLFLGPSSTMMDKLGDLPSHEPILFWLDAHFPGADYQIRPYEDVEDEALRLPLRDELALIKHHRPLNQDVILIDDARIWLDGDYDNGNIDPELAGCRPSQLGIDFIQAMFDTTHRIEVLTRDEGYILLTPLY